MATARHPQHMGVPVRSRQLAHFDPMPKGLLTMWIVRLTDQPGAYGPFDDRASADRFANFLTNEVDPAHIEQLHDPVTELLNWRDAQAARPSVRGGDQLNPSDEDAYREEQGT